MRKKLWDLGAANAEAQVDFLTAGKQRKPTPARRRRLEKKGHGGRKQITVARQRELDPQPPHALDNALATVAEALQRPVPDGQDDDPSYGLLLTDVHHVQQPGRFVGWYPRFRAEAGFEHLRQQHPNVAVSLIFRMRTAVFGCFHYPPLDEGDAA